MAPRLTIDKRRIRNHFHYFWWQYVLLVLVAVFGWNLIHTTTRYRSPEHLKVEWYYEGYISEETTERTARLLESVTPELFPEMEEVTFDIVGMDEQYGPMQLMVWTTTGQGDLYMLPEDHFENIATSGVLADLRPYVEDGTLCMDAVKLEDCYYVVDPESGESLLVGIPTDTLPGFLDCHLEYQGKYMGMLVHGGNVDNTAKLMGYFLKNFQ